MKVTILTLLLPGLVLAYPYAQRSTEVSSRPSRGKLRFNIEEIPLSASDGDSWIPSRKEDFRRRSGHESQGEPDTASSVVSPVTQQLLSSRNSSFRRGTSSSTQSNEDSPRSRANFNRRGSNSQEKVDRGFPSRRRESVTEITQSPYKSQLVEETTHETSNENYPTISVEPMKNVLSIETSISTTPSLPSSQAPTASGFNRRRTSSNRNTDITPRSSVSTSDNFPGRQTRFESSKRRQSPEVVQETITSEGRRNGRRNSLRGSVKANPTDVSTNTGTITQDITSRSRNSGRRDSSTVRSGRGEKNILPSSSSPFTARSRTSTSQLKPIEENENIRNIIPAQDLPEEQPLIASKRMDTVVETSEEPVVPDHTEIISSELDLSSIPSEVNTPSSSEFPSTADSSENTPKPIEILQTNRRKSSLGRSQSSSRDPVFNERAVKSRTQTNTQNTAVGTTSRRGNLRASRLNDNNADYSTNSNTGYEESFNINSLNSRRDHKISPSNIEELSQRPVTNSRRKPSNSRVPLEESETYISGASFRGSSRRNWETLKSSNDVNADSSTTSISTTRNGASRRNSAPEVNKRLTVSEQRSNRGFNVDRSEPRVDEISSRRGSRTRSNTTSRTESNSFESTRPVARSGRKISEADVTSAAQRTSRINTPDVGQRGSLKANTSTRKTPKSKKIAGEDEEIDESDNYPAGFLKALKALKLTKNEQTSLSSDENQKLTSTLKRPNNKNTEKENDESSNLKGRTRKVSLLLAPSPPSESTEQDAKSQSNDVFVLQDQEKSKNVTQNKSKPTTSSSDTIVSGRASIRSTNSNKAETLSVGKSRSALKSTRNNQVETSASNMQDTSHQVSSSTSAPFRRTVSRTGSHTYRDSKADSAKASDESLQFELTSTTDLEHHVKDVPSGRPIPENNNFKSTLSTSTTRSGYQFRSRSYKVTTAIPTIETNSRNTYSSRTRSSTSQSPPSRINSSLKQSTSATISASIPDPTPQSVFIQSPIAPPSPHRFSARYRNDLLRATGALRVTTTPAYVPTVPTVSTTTSTTTTTLPDTPVENPSEALTLDASSLTLDTSSSTLTDKDSDTSILSLESAPNIKDSNELYGSSTEIDLQTFSDTLENPHSSDFNNIIKYLSLPVTPLVTTMPSETTTNILSNVAIKPVNVQAVERGNIGKIINPLTNIYPTFIPTAKASTKKNIATTTLKASTSPPVTVKIPRSTATALIDAFDLVNSIKGIRNPTTSKPIITRSISTTTRNIITTTTKPTTTTTSTVTPSSTSMIPSIIATTPTIITIPITTTTITTTTADTTTSLPPTTAASTTVTITTSIPTTSNTTPRTTTTSSTTPSTTTTSSITPSTTTTSSTTTTIPSTTSTTNNTTILPKTVTPITTTSVTITQPKIKTKPINLNQLLTEKSATLIPSTNTNKFATESSSISSEKSPISITPTVLAISSDDSVKQKETSNSFSKSSFSTHETFSDIGLKNNTKLTLSSRILPLSSLSPSLDASTNAITTTPSGRFSTRLTVAPRGTLLGTNTLPPPPEFAQSINFEILNSDEASIYNPPPPVQYIYTQPPSTRRTPAPYVIFGIFPNNTIFRKFPDSDVKEIVSENEISRPQEYYPDEYRTSTETNKPIHSAQEPKGYTNMDHIQQTNQDAKNTALYNLHHSSENEVLRTNAATFARGGSEPDLSAQPTVSGISTTINASEIMPVTVSTQPVSQIPPAIVQPSVEFSNSVYNGQDNKYKNFWASTSTKKPQFRILTTDIPVSTPASPSSTVVFIVTPDPPTTPSITTEAFRWKPINDSSTTQNIERSTRKLQNDVPTSQTSTTTVKIATTLTTTRAPAVGLRGLISQVLGRPVSSTMSSTSEIAINSPTMITPTSALDLSLTLKSLFTNQLPSSTTNKPDVTNKQTSPPITTPTFTTTSKPGTTTERKETSTKVLSTSTTNSVPTAGTTKKPDAINTSKSPPTTTVKSPITTTTKKAAVTTTKKPVTTTTTKKPTTTTTKNLVQASTQKPVATSTQIPVTTTTQRPVTTTTQKPTTTTTYKPPTTTSQRPTTSTTKQPITTTTKQPITTTTKKTITTTTKKPVTTSKPITTTTKKPVTTSKPITTTTKKPVTSSSKPITTTTKKPVTMTTTKKPVTTTTMKSVTTTSKKPIITSTERLFTTTKMTTKSPSVTSSTVIPSTTTTHGTSTPTSKGSAANSLGGLSFLNSLFGGQQENKKQPAKERTEELANKVIEVAVQRASTSSTTSHPTLKNKDSQLILPSAMLQDQLQEKPRTSREKDVAMANKVIEAALQRPSTSTTTPSAPVATSTTLSPDEQFLVALLNSQSKKTTTSPPQTKQSTTLKISPEEQFIDALRQSQLKGAATVMPKPQTPVPRKLSPDEQFLAALLQSQLGGPSTSKPKSQGSNLKLTDEQLLAALLGGAQIGGGSQSKNQNIRTSPIVPTTATKSPAAFGGLFGQLGGGNTLLDPEANDDEGDSPRGQRLVKAAIDVTKAVSQFMNVVIQGASERFQTFFKSGTSLLSNYFSWGSSQAGSI